MEFSAGATVDWRPLKKKCVALKAAARVMADMKSTLFRIRRLSYIKLPAAEL